MAPIQPVLTGEYVRLEPLTTGHVDALAEAASGDRELYQWTFVPDGVAEVTDYVTAALADGDAGASIPFATVRRSDGRVLGSTRFCFIERWNWPDDHPRAVIDDRIDGCEIGYTWLTGDAVRTAANTETKALMLGYAFEARHALRVRFHTDARNTRSRTAIERIGGRFEGILRAHRMSSDFLPRDSARFAIVADEWPQARLDLIERLRRRYQSG